MTNKTLSTGVTRFELFLDSQGYAAQLEASPGDNWLDEDDGPLETWIVGQGGRIEPRSIALGEEPILQDLLNMEATPKGAAAFAASWGLFKLPTPPGMAPAPTRVRAWSGCPVEEFYKTRREIRDAWTIGNRGGVKELARRRANYEELVLGDATIRLRATQAGVPDVLWYVEDLRTFCWLELWREFRVASELIECKTCGRIFSRYRKGRVPQTCSQRCKKARQRLKVVRGGRR